MKLFSHQIISQTCRVRWSLTFQSFGHLCVVFKLVLFVTGLHDTRPCFVLFTKKNSDTVQCSPSPQCWERECRDVTNCILLSDWQWCCWPSRKTLVLSWCASADCAAHWTRECFQCLRNFDLKTLPSKLIVSRMIYAAVLPHCMQIWLQEIV